VSGSRRCTRGEGRHTLVRVGTELQRSRANLARQLRAQAAEVRQIGSPLSGEILTWAAADVEDWGPTWGVLAGREGASRSMVALRLLGAVHRLVLEGRAPALASFYPSVGGKADSPGLWEAFRGVLVEHHDELRELAARPVQTNEVGRSAALLGGFLVLTRETGHPLRLLELGASAGLNLRWDHYRYEMSGLWWGDSGSPVRIDAQLLTGRLPLDIDVDVVERSGCDPAPVDPMTEEGRLTLRSYVWPDQSERHTRLEAAISLARVVPTRVDQAQAGEWLEGRLREPAEGATTVVFHSIVMQYLSGEERHRVDEAIRTAGEEARSSAPIARLAMEPAGDQAEIWLTTWPGGRSRRLAYAGYHGSPLWWTREEPPAPVDAST
jgi:hypothetical protein